MKRMLSGLLAALAVPLLSVIAFAAESPIVVTHKVAGYEKGEKLATVSYTLHVTNRSDKSVSDLRLKVIPFRFMAGTIPILTVGTLPANGSADVSFQVKAPAAAPEKVMAGQSLFLAGKCVDADGALVEFPAESRPGGAK